MLNRVKSADGRTVLSWLPVVALWLLAAATLIIYQPLISLVLIAASLLLIPAVQETIIKDFYISKIYIYIFVITIIFIGVPLVFSPTAEQQANIDERAAEKIVQEDDKYVSQNTDKAMLVTQCELAVKPQLKNPNSFDVDMSRTVVYDHEGMLVLDMFYYAENSYGASGINEVFCEFTQRGTLVKVLHDTSF